jgi:hypothetical protein
MKVKTPIIFAIGVIIASAWSMPAYSAVASPTENLGLPTLPDATLVTEISLSPGNLLDALARDYGPWLGFSSLRQVNAFIYNINPTRSSQEIFGFYGPAIAQQNWKTMVKSFDKGRALAVLYNEQNGMLIINIEPPGREDRQATIVRIFGKMDPTKVANPEMKLPDLFKRVVESAAPGSTGADVRGASRIPTGQPISVPPSSRLHVKSTRSEIRAQVFDRTTVEVRLASRSDDPGELVRIEDRLVLALTPKLAVSELILPGAVPILLELTEGSLTLSCGPGPNDRPVRLNVASTGAGVTLDAFPLISGTHMVKSVGGEVRIALSAAQGGVLTAEVTGRDLTVAIPKNASARVTATVTSGRIDNLTGVQPQDSGPDRMSLQFGAGKAEIALRAINGRICIRYAD